MEGSLPPYAGAAAAVDAAGEAVAEVPTELSLRVPPASERTVCAPAGTSVAETIPRTATAAVRTAATARRRGSGTGHDRIGEVLPRR